MRRMLAMLLLCATSAVFGGPVAWLDRYTIDEGEILRLTIETEGDVPGDPDTDPLLPDFTIDGIANGHRQIRSANGFINYTTWTITLRPRRAGRLQIPSLHVNGAPTPPLGVEVRPAPRVRQQDGGQAFLLGEVDRPRPWRQAMVRYTVRLFHDLPIANASLNVPTPPGAMMTRLKGERISVATVDGRRYKVIERHYALFPEKAGALTIPAPILEARRPPLPATFDSTSSTAAATRCRTTAASSIVSSPPPAPFASTASRLRWRSSPRRRTRTDDSGCRPPR